MPELIRKNIKLMPTSPKVLTRKAIVFTHGVPAILYGRCNVKRSGYKKGAKGESTAQGTTIPFGTRLVSDTWRHRFLVEKGGSAERVIGHHHPGLFLNPVLLPLCLASAIKASNQIR